MNKMKLRRSRSLWGVLLTAFLVASWGVAADRATAAIYWGSGQSVGGANLDGTAADPSYIGSFNSLEISSVCGVAVDATHIYWVDRFRDQIGRANLDGTEPNFSFIQGVQQPCGIAVDGSHIYWANTGGRSIGRANLDGTGVTHQFLGGMLEPCGVAMNDGFLYWASPREDAVGRYPINVEGIGSSRFIEGADAACGVAFTDSHIFWGSYAQAIGRADRDGSNVIPEFVAGLDRPAAIAVDAAHIYWTEEVFGAPGSVGVANLDGSSVNRSLVPGLTSPNGIAVDAQPFPLDRSAHQLPSWFAFAKVKYAKDRRDPVTYFAVDVPGPGTYSVSVPRGIGWNIVSSEPDEGVFASPGRKWSSLYLIDTRAGRRLARRVRKKGKIRVPVTFRYQAVDHNETAKVKRFSLLGIRATRRPITLRPPGR